MGMKSSAVESGNGQGYHHCKSVYSGYKVDKSLEGASAAMDSSGRLAVGLGLIDGRKSLNSGGSSCSARNEQRTIKAVGRCETRRGNTTEHLIHTRLHQLEKSLMGQPPHLGRVSRQSKCAGAGNSRGSVAAGSPCTSCLWRGRIE